MRVAVALGLAILLLTAVSAPEAAAQKRLPKGYQWGRCVLLADGKMRISGKCAYELDKDGGFHIAGPRQVYEGIDYHNPDHVGAGERSNDYWANIFRDPDGSWTGYGNSDFRETHGTQVYGALAKQGACFVGKIDKGETDAGEHIWGGPVRICLWRS